MTKCNCHAGSLNYIDPKCPCNDPSEHSAVYVCDDPGCACWDKRETDEERFARHGEIRRLNDLLSSGRDFEIDRMGRAHIAEPMKPKFSLIPADALNVVAGVMTWGNIGSHEEGDWEALTSEREHIDKTLRHINNHQRGNLYDESGYHHLAHAAADCLIALALLIRGRNGKGKPG